MARNIPAHSASIPEEIQIFSFHHQRECDARLGIGAGCYTFSDPIGAHCHDFWEIAFALRGYGHHEDEQSRIPLLSGDVWIICPGQWHAYPLVRDSLSIFNLLFTHEFLQEHLHTLQEVSYLGEVSSSSPPLIDPVHLLRLSARGLEHISTLLATLTAELNTANQPGRTGLCTGLTLQILALLERYSCENTAGRDSDKLRHDPGVLAAVQFIQEAYTEPVTLEEIARKSGYTPTYLARKFRQYLGMPPIDYLLQVRIHHACLLLQTTGLSVTRIAHAVGFADSRYFATRFRSALHMTPTQFRQRARCTSFPMRVPTQEQAGSEIT